ncbi:uncharacterized protein LOC123878262 isoform X2 [Maniola jurtina]|uniref:uncharacterized protein LOC123878262 isoform X2 n=1 Tax=Maniola jurtina TaxID=191418 RepID=UPI001E687BAC|nr:uncharacterized protein LOC123878262 isoform X2 [Maniola jurtina]
MELLQMCVNCNIALKRIKRFKILSLPPDMTDLLTEWLTSEVSPDSCICTVCYDIMTRCIATNSRERQRGYTSVCYGCGKSVASARRFSIPENLALVVLSWHQYVRASDYLCFRCVQKAKRHMARRNTADAARLQDDTVQPDEKPAIQEIQASASPSQRCLATSNIKADNSIVLPNYKRCANTSSRCIFQGCRRRIGHNVPTWIKSAMLSNNKLFIPRRARVCERHLNSNEWDSLINNKNLTNTFTAEHIESMLDYKRENVIDFENVETMPDNICHYWTGHTTKEFIDLYNAIPIQSAVTKKSKSALAMFLIKCRTKDSNARLSRLFKVPRSTVQTKVSLAKNCLANHLSSRDAST